MKGLKIFFLIIAFSSAVFTAFIFFNKTTALKTEKAVEIISEKSIKLQKNKLKIIPQSTEDIQKEKAQALKEQRDYDLQLRKQRTEDLQIYFGFGTTILSSIVSIALAIINRKKA